MAIMVSEFSFEYGI